MLVTATGQDLAITGHQKGVPRATCYLQQGRIRCTGPAGAKSSTEVASLASRMSSEPAAPDSISCGWDRAGVLAMPELPI